MLRNFGGLLHVLLLVHLNIMIATDFDNGRRDPFGPYPRIPDKELVQQEIAFAEECKKFMKAPQTVFIN
uniref:Uncharacterized protein n=1 Tax=Brachymyrmex patagonicus TaxID=604570 RepID=F1AG51_9HYME|nr:hypothetical protein [Brachymyrmex patagonicus]